MDLIIVSSNRAKYLHIRDCIKRLRPNVSVRCSLEFSKLPPLFDEEECSSLQEISTKKALYTMRQLTLPCLADETLLIVPALGMEKPALEQKRSHAHSGKMLPNTKALLQALQGKEGLQRAAYLETTLTLALPSQEPELHHTITRQEGYISEEERGSAHFDFGSVFMKHDYNKTLAELPETTQIRISHRLKGLERLLALFEKWGATSSFKSLQKTSDE